MDKSLVEALVNASSSFIFYKWGEELGHPNLILVKHKHESLNKYVFGFNVSTTPIDQIRSCDNGIGVYTFHPIYTNGESRSVLNRCWNICRKDKQSVGPFSDLNFTMFSKKPCDEERRKTETLIQLLDRWGMVVSAENWTKAQNNDKKEICVTQSKPIRVIYSTKGETFCYNKITEHEHFVEVSFDENQIDKKIVFGDQQQPIYIGKRIGLVKLERNRRWSHRASEAFATGDEMLERISKLKVAVIGAGGTGSVVIETLAKRGVRDIKIYDSDVIEQSNVDRLSILTKTNDEIINKRKVDLFDGLKDLDIKKFEHLSVDNIDTLKDRHLVICCADKVDVRKELAKFVSDHKIPYVNIAIGYDPALFCQHFVFNFYCNPIVEQINVRKTEKNVDEYKELSNLQFTEGTLFAGMMISLLLSKVTGLYADPDINDLITKDIWELSNVGEEDSYVE